MNTIVEKNNSKIFPKNENSKDMLAPPVSPKSHQTKFAEIKAIFEQNASHTQAKDSNKTVSNNLGRSFGLTIRKLMENGDINIHVSASTLSKQRRNSGDSGISSCSEKSNVSDISDKFNNSNIVKCSITRSNSKKDLRKPDALHKQEPSSEVFGAKVNDVRNRVKKLIDQFEQGGRCYVLPLLLYTKGWGVFKTGYFSWACYPLILFFQKQPQEKF